MNNIYKSVPTYDYNTSTWLDTEFFTYNDFKDFIRGLFKDEGPTEGYNFDECSLLFNEQWRNYKKNGFYCSAPFKSKDFVDYWDFEKRKCTQGVIFMKDGKVWYLTREYYMWLNFLPIFDKEESEFSCPKVRDVQYHMALYELLAELNWKHIAILKKRQIASSYYHAAKIINTFWFESGSVCKMGASLKKYIDESGTWRMLMEYRDFLNGSTAWYRPLEPDKVFSWQQKIKVRTNGRDTYRGNKSVILGTTFEKDPTSGVGGPCKYFFHEEAGIAPKMMDTYEFMRPAFQSGLMTTGTFIAAGSVGDLDQCEPLKQMILNPEIYSIYPVTTSLLDENGTISKTGLFLPEHWSMPPYIDRYGNSVIFTPTSQQADDIREEWLKKGYDIKDFDPTRGAIEAVKQERIKDERDLNPEQFQLRKSQKPLNISEAFASRSVSVFKSHIIQAQKKRIENKEYPVEYLELYRENSEILAKPSKKSPITEFPISKSTEDKTGTICVYERPDPKAKWGTYYASIDPVGEGKTTTSESLCSIYVYKNQVEVLRDEGNGKVSSSIEGDKIVCSWCGRFDDIRDTHERLELIIEWYNAWTVVENNVSLFIQYMISKRKQKYLVPKDQILFLKELGSNSNVYQEYGWKNTGTLFKNHLLNYAIEFTQEKIFVETNENGDIVKTKLGVERIPDIMLIKEMEAYQHGLNVDRLVSFTALVALVAIQNASRGILRRVERLTEVAQNPEKFSKFNRTPFSNIGVSKSPLGNRPNRNPFKNLK